MKSLRKKMTATLLIAIFMVSMMSFVVALPVQFPPEYGIWLPNPDNGLVECSDAQSKGGSYSAYLHVNYPTNPASQYGSDSTEVYVRPQADGNMRVPLLLEDLDSFSFWYYWPSGVNSEIPPQVDIWLASTPPTEDAWLLGQIALATSTDTWVEVPLSAITWINAMGGQIYGTGSEGLENAKDGTNGPAWGASTIMGLGVMIGSPATRDEARTSVGDYYIDDIEINGEIFDFEFSETTTLETTVELPIVSISVTPTDVDYGTLMRGETSATKVITVDNIGDVPVDISASVIEDEAFYASYLTLDTLSVSAWEALDLAPLDPDLTIDSVLTLPSNFAFFGDYTGTLVFWAEETP